MSDLDPGLAAALAQDPAQRSLAYFASAPVDGQWGDFLQVLAEELGGQMDATEIRAFFAVLGRRIARRNPLPPGDSLPGLENFVNEYLNRCRWGWVRVIDFGSHLEFLHSCAPLRRAFGDAAMAWAPALLEGLYGEWLKQLGADPTLMVQQVGEAEGTTDTLRLRLAQASRFAEA